LDKHQLPKPENLNQLLLELAVRKPFGLTPATPNLFSDTTEKSLWAWELLFPQRDLPQSLQIKQQDIRFSSTHKSQLLKQAHKCSHTQKPKDLQAY
jgi:hypothetical protein